MASIREMMDRIELIRKRIETVPEVVEWMVHDHADEIVSLNQDQMLLGRDADGNVLTPDYLSDPYFETKAQAINYANMKYLLESKHKARIEHTLNYPDKGRNTPNLIVTGLFQDNMFIRTTSDNFTIGSTYVDAPDIEAKYKNRVFGLAPLSKEWFWKAYLRNAIVRHLKLWGPDADV